MRKALGASVLIITWAAIGATPAGAGAGPTVDSVGIVQGTSLTPLAGSNHYFWGMVTGGQYVTSSMAKGQKRDVVDANGNLATALAVTTSNSNSYTTSTVYHVLAAAGVSNYSRFTATYRSNPGPASGLSLRARVTVPAGGLVLVIALGSSQQCYSLTGVPGLHDDADGSTVEAIEVAHAFPGAGTYTVSGARRPASPRRIRTTSPTSWESGCSPLNPPVPTSRPAEPGSCRTTGRDTGSEG